MAQTTFDEVLEAIELLPADAQADLLEIVRRRLAERGRQRVVTEVRDARAQYDQGFSQPVNVDDLLREMET